MRNKTMRTAALCLALTLASCSVESVTLRAAEISQVSEEAGAAEQAEETKAPETQAPPPETQAPQTQAPETQAPPPETQAPQTQAPETQPPQTQAPETQPTETQPPQTQAPETQVPETQPPQTQPGTELPGETQTESGSSSGDVVIEEVETVPATETGGSETLETNLTGTETGETLTESESDTETESETDGLSIEESEEMTEAETSEFSSNEELIAHQNIVMPPKLTLEFRFTQVEKQIELVRSKDGAAVYEKRSEDGRKVGALSYHGLCYVLEDSGDGWCYVESGQVRGFMKKAEFVPEVIRQRLLANKPEDSFELAEALVPRRENQAFTYTHTTVQQTVVPKVYAVAAADLNIMESKNKDARVIGTLPKGGLCYLLADTDRSWIFVESGNARGFVQADRLLSEAVSKRKVQQTGENNMESASVNVKPEDNRACYYTLTSIKEASHEAKLREEMVNFSTQFLGNPYVWGGTSLTNGCDCSGFVQSIYANFGYYLPRVADAQSVCGMQIPVSEAEPGDLVFYAKKGYVYHVSMYIGNGQVIQAANRRRGIIISGIGGDAVWATRVIHE